MNLVRNKILVLAVAALSLAGCQKNVGSTSISTRGSGPRAMINAGNTNAQTVSGLRGLIYSDANYQNEFQRAVTGFLSTDIREDYVGSVSATGANGSGVRFGGKVMLTSGSLRNLTGGYAQIATGSSISIQVVDSVPGMSSVPPLPAFTFSTASGMISGTNVQITFQDAYGSVTMNGQLNTSQNIFQGTISYDNAIALNGQTPGAAGNLGNFQISVCEFFVCN